MGKLRQAHTTLACSLGNFITGLLLAWPSYTIQHYTAQNTTLLAEPMTDVESSLVGSLPSLGGLTGSALVGSVLSIVGKKKGGLLIAVPILISWLMIDFTKSSTVILMARFLGGLSIGAFQVLSPLFVSEIAEESIRGALASVPMTLYCCGIFVSYLLGWFLTYHTIIWTNVTCCIVYMILIMTVTEGPVFLLRQRREKEARLAIAHYRGVSVTSKLVEDEFSRLKQQIVPEVEVLQIDSDGKLKTEESEKEKLNQEKQEIEETKKISTFKMLLFTSPSQRAFVLVTLTISLQVMMGMVAVQVYAKDIFVSAAPSISSDLCSVMFALVLLLGSLLGTLFSDKFGRRILLISSSIVVSLCLAGMGVLMQSKLLPWMTAALILVYCFAFMFGAGNVPYVLLTEVFVAEVQSLASMVLIIFMWLMNFVVVGIFPFMIKFLGVHGSFYCFALFGVTNALVGFFLIPETKGLTNEQIQDVLLRKALK